MPSGIYIHRRGYTMSKDTKNKMSISHKGFKFSEESKRKMSNTKKGKVFSLEARLKMSKGHKGMKKPWVSMSNKKRLMEKHPNWKGGKSFEPYTVDWTETLKRSIRERDKYNCQVCGNK